MSARKYRLRAKQAADTRARTDRAVERLAAGEQLGPTSRRLVEERIARMRARGRDAEARKLARKLAPPKKKAPAKKAPAKKAPAKKAAPATKKPATKKPSTKKPSTKKPAKSEVDELKAKLAAAEKREAEAKKREAEAKKKLAEERKAARPRPRRPVTLGLRPRQRPPLQIRTPDSTAIDKFEKIYRAIPAPTVKHAKSTIGTPGLDRAWQQVNRSTKITTNRRNVWLQLDGLIVGPESIEQIAAQAARAAAAILPQGKRVVFSAQMTLLSMEPPDNYAVGYAGRVVAVTLDDEPIVRSQRPTKRTTSLKTFEDSVAEAIRREVAARMTRSMLVGVDMIDIYIKELK